MTNLAGVGNVVDADYAHVAKRIAPAEPLVLPDSYLKWYRRCLDAVPALGSGRGGQARVRRVAVAGTI